MIPSQGINRSVSLALAFGLLLLSGCNTKSEDRYMKEWLAAAQLTAQQTPEELYQLALKEDTLVIYSESTRVVDTAKSFMAQYPGLTVSVVDVRANDMIPILKDNFESKQYLCDLLLRSDNDGVLSRELMPLGIAHKYLPAHIADKMIPMGNENALPIVAEIQMLAYNNKIYGESPVQNWWELIEPKWQGKVAIANPVRSVTAIAFLSMLVKEEALLRESYEEFYGQPIPITESENAGEYFIQRLVENGLIVTNSSDEVAQLVGDPTQTEPMLGILLSSKLRLADIGYNLALADALEPFCGVNLPNSISLSGGAKNVNAAKLFIRYLLGETDGQGEGAKPYMQNGAWPVRTDVVSESAKSLTELNVLSVDSGFVYDNAEKIKTFWLSLQAQ